VVLTTRSCSASTSPLPLKLNSRRSPPSPSSLQSRRSLLSVMPDVARGRRGHAGDAESLMSILRCRSPRRGHRARSSCPCRCRGALAASLRSNVANAPLGSVRLTAASGPRRAPYHPRISCRIGVVVSVASCRPAPYAGRRQVAAGDVRSTSRHCCSHGKGRGAGAGDVMAPVPVVCTSVKVEAPRLVRRIPPVTRRSPGSPSAPRGPRAVGQPIPVPR